MAGAAPRKRLQEKSAHGVDRTVHQSPQGRFAVVADPRGMLRLAGEADTVKVPAKGVALRSLEGGPVPALLTAATV